jgi:MFS family permease
VRRGVAATAAVVLFVEALGLAFVNWVMGIAVRHQAMSLAGLDPAAMAAGAWVAGGLLALFLIACAVVLAGTARHDRSPRGFGRLLLIAAAVLNVILGAAVVGLLGWPAYVLMMLIFALIVLSLTLYAAERPAPTDDDASPPGAPVAA